MADKLEFSEKLVYDYFKQHTLHKSGADAVIQMVQFVLNQTFKRLKSAYFFVE